MLRRVLILAATLLVVAFSLSGPVLGATAGPRDPCKDPHRKGKHHDDPCQNIPEAPVSLLYPAAGVVVLLSFGAFEWRRRRTAAAA
jgi:hypothetical protein